MKTLQKNDKWLRFYENAEVRGVWHDPDLDLEVEASLRVGVNLKIGVNLSP
jgi:hypothetical protein